MFIVQTLVVIGTDLAILIKCFGQHFNSRRDACWVCEKRIENERLSSAAQQQLVLHVLTQVIIESKTKH